MSKVKDPKIKLFGKTIELPENSAADVAGEPVSARSCEPAVGDDRSNLDPACSSDSMLEDSNFLSGDAEEQESPKVETLSIPEQDNSKEEILAKAKTTQPTITDSNALSDSDTSMKTSKTEVDQTETTSDNSNEKALKKPDKILPCPRCNSMETKFCYFNNYNVNQPRHFCKNCQRYWTAGGTMRNVPVGAGRRKNKNSVCQFHHLTVPEALQPPNGIHHPNGTVLTFGSDSPLCESITSVLNITKNRQRKPEEPGISVSPGIKENRDDCTDEVGNNKTRLFEPMPICHPFSYPGPNWPYPWNPLQWGPGSFPVPFYSAAAAPSFWGWNVPWVIPSVGPAPSAAPGPNLSTLGKHSREDNVDHKDDPKEEESNREKCLWAPKTLRIDDLGEAAKSSIWATLGIKNDGVNCVGGDGLFKAFLKGDEKARVPETSTVLQANPAALSRSLSFHESS